MCMYMRETVGSFLQMDKGKIRGCDVYVEFASEDNGFFELPPEAAKNLWTQMGTCILYI